MGCVNRANLLGCHLDLSVGMICSPNLNLICTYWFRPEGLESTMRRQHLNFVVSMAAMETVYFTV